MSGCVFDSWLISESMVEKTYLYLITKSEASVYSICLGFEHVPSNAMLDFLYRYSPLIGIA